MKIGVLEEEFVIYKSLDTPNINIDIFSIIQEVDGISVIAFKNDTNFKHSPIFRAFYLDELNDFSQSGILYQVLKPLKENNISVLVLSAFNRDYVFIDKNLFDTALSLIKET